MHDLKKDVHNVLAKVPSKNELRAILAESKNEQTERNDNKYASKDIEKKVEEFETKFAPMSTANTFNKYRDAVILMVIAGLVGLLFIVQ